ncbi:P-loop containing nucleoside triphosphate hydrolase protein [Lipomyces tetrasporus]|uniref:P-loop containing nucleoside triphosphate hydrolase protein n=1 Tax=Lipomyces tetrasporus TaxID=54092 RepID=A0AAD7VNU6_9ASCO|nr:P-loop containing nucleoside triphosphate hydrolase protein [Lipomyces tetrasporus]KAJ8096727.1 P-loop containing nucleoside triphosphate hydrolase protein [Lipomyces tetrasporus]
MDSSADEKSPLVKSDLFDKSPLSSSASINTDRERFIDVDVSVDEFSHLAPHEAKVLRDQVIIKPTIVNFFSFYRYATAKDILLLLIATACAIADGCMRPLMTFIFGSITQTFTAYAAQQNMGYYNGTNYGFDDKYDDTAQHEFNRTFADHNTADYYESPLRYISPDKFQMEVNHLTLYLVYIGIVDIIISYIAMYIFIDRGEILSGRIKENYLAATLRQNIGYFDKLGSGEITVRLSADTILIQEGMSEKVSYIISNGTMFFAAFAIGFIRAYKLTFIMMSIAAFILITFVWVLNKMAHYYTKALEGSSTGGSIAEEVLSSIRTVQAFGIQDRLASRYDKYLAISEKWAFKAGIALGSVTGVMWLGVYSNDALGFWQGARFIRAGEETVGGVVTTLMCMILSTYALSNISPHARSITNGMAAAVKIFATIDRKSVIDPYSEAGKTLEKVEGNIELKNVKFIYPSRPNVMVLNNFCLKVPAGKTVALVGASGSGKSTIIGLLERFYEPLSGTVELDGVDINDFNVRWLRQQISLVSQEPTLFGCSIYENIAHGLIGTQYEFASEIEKRELVKEACRQANALAFIDRFPEGLDTSVGERGFLMSGGQKQRIAIARAIVGNPKILLLDEATSALDTRSEGIVQEALDRASKHRTTIVIAHRLSTIKDADNIVVMRHGVIVEQGTHNELITLKGDYYDLVEAQKIEQQTGTLTTFEDTVCDIAAAESDRKAKFQEDGLIGLQRTETASSISSIAIGQKPEKVEVDPADYSLWELISFLYKLNAEENHYNILGAIMSAFTGLGYDAMGLFFGRCVQAFGAIPDYDYMTQQIAIFAGLFFMLACFQFVVTALALALFSFTSQKLVRRIRIRTFRQMLRQDISFYDRDENTTGSLTSMLSQDAQYVEGFGGATMGQVMNSLMMIISGVILALALAWKLAIVCGACLPIIISSGFWRFYVLSVFQNTTKKSNEMAGSYACEATSAIRTVASLTRERDVMAHYHAIIKEQGRVSKRASNRSAFWYGVAQGMQYFTLALAFWYGSSFIRRNEYSLFQFYVTYTTIIVGAEAAGIMFSFAPDMGKAKSATATIKKMLGTVPEIDTWTENGQIPANVRGDVEFRNVHFRYPTRPQVPVLRGLNLKIKQGQYVALVGSSGCGKSTTIGLIESFYRPLSGHILLDGQDITEFNINAYREQIALVQQEPTLYAGTIRENIEFGTSGTVTDEEIYSVCKQANIHDFIVSLPDGYNTMCGSKGSLLSGGQKQRIAIARALIRKPKVLLLDEATSALDSESEKVVQAALDAAAKGRTTIAVAHRLSTIQNADIIYVFDEGKVLESGTHQELLAKKGKYYQLVQLQALERV